MDFWKHCLTLSSRQRIACGITTRLPKHFNQGCVIFLAVVSSYHTSAQTTTGALSSSTSAASITTQAATVSTLAAQRQQLVQSYQTLLAQGASPQQIAAWRQQNAGLLQAHQQSAQALHAIQAAQPLPLVSAIQVPDGAPQTLSSYLTTRADLYNRFAQFHNQNPQAPLATFQKQNAAEISTHIQQSQALATQQAQMPLSMPGPLRLPPNASTQTVAFLTLRDQIVREMITLRNQNLNASSDVKAAAMKQWLQTNAAQIQQLHQLKTQIEDQ